MTARRSRGGENHVSVALWVDEIGRPLAVEQVTATLFSLDADQGGAKTILEGPIPMVQSDQAHKYLAVFALPENTYNGSTLFVDQEAVLTADGTSLHLIETIWIDAPLDNQTMRVRF